MAERTRYKVVETSTVTEEELEAILNRWSALGWTFDGMHFVVRDASRRPAMAFVLFTRAADDAGPAAPNPHQGEENP